MSKATAENKARVEVRNLWAKYAPRGVRGNDISAMKRLVWAQEAFITAVCKGHATATLGAAKALTALLQANAF